MRTLLLSLIGLLLAFGLGFMTHAWYASGQRDRLVAEESSVLLERVRSVLKMVTVEGDIQQIYNSTQSRDVTLYLPLPTRFSFDKQATVEVNGTVLVGYDLQQLDVSVLPDARQLVVRNFPDPEILAIDHELSYRNLNESWFNTFTARDYSELNRRAKEALRTKALESELIDEARREGKSVLDGLEYLARSAGYELVVEGPLTPGRGDQGSRNSRDMAN